MLQYFFCSMVWFFGHWACGILAPQPGMEPLPPALEGGDLTTGCQGSRRVPFWSLKVWHWRVSAHACGNWAMLEDEDEPTACFSGWHWWCPQPGAGCLAGSCCEWGCGVLGYMCLSRSRWVEGAPRPLCCSVMSDSLQPHGLQHARLPCLSPSPRVFSNSCPLSQWCHPTFHPLSSPSPPAFNLSQHQGLF